MKPFLTNEHHIAQVDQCLSKVDGESPGHFQNLYDEVHVDEKWFYLTEDGLTYILAEGEEPPKRKVRHKGFIA